MCEIKSYLVPQTDGGRLYANAPTTSQTRCTTHGWCWPTGATVGVNDKCPLGRIEEATEVALAKIAAAK